MALSDMKEAIRHRLAGFERRYETRVFWFPDQSPSYAIVESRLLDTYHDMALFLRVNLQTRKIEDVDVEENRVPYSSCPLAVATYRYLIGEDMSERGLIGKYPFARPEGCLHLNEMLEHAVRNFNSAYGFYLKDRNFPADMDEYRMHVGERSLNDRIELGRHWWMKDRNVRNSCLSLSVSQEKQEYRDQIKDLPGITQMMVREFRKKNS